jgi:hypothetical protein
MEAKIIGTPFKAGNPGKLKGTKNKLTKTVKETVLAVFNDLQKDPKHSLKAFARRYPREFYVIASKLIPTEIKADIKVPEGIQIIMQPATECKPIGFIPDDSVPN